MQCGCAAERDVAADGAGRVCALRGVFFFDSKHFHYLTARS
jgi:hypothetical protein